MTTLIGTIIGIKRNPTALLQAYGRFFKRSWELMRETWIVLGDASKEQDTLASRDY